MIPELGWPPCRRHGRGFRRATCGPLLRVAGNASSLESLPRRSVPQTAFCSSPQSFGLRGPRSCTRLLWIVVLTASASKHAVTPKLSLRVRTTLDSNSCPRCVRLCATWSVGTSRRRHVRNALTGHHVWWSLLLLAQPFCSDPCLVQTCTKHVQRRVRSLLANRPIAMP